MTATITVTLPWPDRALSPNARVHWSAWMRATRKDKAIAHALTREAMGRMRVAEVVSMRVLWCQPDRRGRDDDNMAGSFKAFRDGIALALGLDDVGLRPLHNPDGPRSPDGKVVVTIEVVLK